MDIQRRYLRRDEERSHYGKITDTLTSEECKTIDCMPEYAVLVQNELYAMSNELIEALFKLIQEKTNFNLLAIKLHVISHMKPARPGTCDIPCYTNGCTEPCYNDKGHTGRCDRMCLC